MGSGGWNQLLVPFSLSRCVPRTQLTDSKVAIPVRPGYPRRSFQRLIWFGKYRTNWSKRFVRGQPLYRYALREGCRGFFKVTVDGQGKVVRDAENTDCFKV